MAGRYWPQIAQGPSRVGSALIGLLAVGLILAVVTPPAAAAPIAAAPAVPLHVQITSRPASRIDSLNVTPAKAYVGDEIRVSGKLLAGSSAIAGATVAVGFQEAVASGSGAGPAGGAASAAPVEPIAASTDEQGAFAASLPTAGLAPSSYAVYASGPVNHAVYARSAVQAVIEVWDRTKIALRARTDADAVTRVEGRLTTAHGVGVGRAVTLRISGYGQTTVTAAADGAFAWTVKGLAPWERTIDATFAGARYLEPSQASIKHDPSPKAWTVTLTASQGRFVLPDTKTTIGMRVDGATWPPEALTLELTAARSGQKAIVLGRVNVTSRETSIPLSLPSEPGLYAITAVRGQTVAAAGQAASQPHRVNSNSLEIAVYAPTRLTLAKAKGPDGPALVARLSSLGRPVAGQSCEILRNGRPAAAGKIGKDGDLRLPPPLKPGVYQAVFRPEAGSYYLAATSATRRILPTWWLVGGGGAAAVAALAGALLWRRSRRRRALPGIPPDPTERGAGAPTEEEILRLPAREQVIRLYEALVVADLAPVLPPDPAQTQWAYWRRISEVLPDTRHPFRDLVTLYQEARYSLHEVAPRAAEAAWSLAGAIRATIARTRATPGDAADGKEHHATPAG
jgi:hypothetical protein